ncbi:MAG: Crp/Fnr family transcriptional regulator [Alphaproteobacteria bacterium]
MSDYIQRLFEGGAQCRLAASEPLFHSGDHVSFMYLVIDGQMELTRQTSTGMSVTLQLARSGQVLAEASAYSDAYHCDARAIAETTLRSVSVATFRSRLAQDRQAADDWAAYLAHAVQSARMRAEIRTLRTVAERLDAWLGETLTMPEKGTWTELAAELGVSREALYRELGKRRQVGC